MLKSSSQSKKSQGQSSTRGFGAMPKSQVNRLLVRVDKVLVEVVPQANNNNHKFLT